MGGSRVINVKRLRTCDAHHDDINLWRLKRCVCILLESVFFIKYQKVLCHTMASSRKKQHHFIYACMRPTSVYVTPRVSIIFHLD